MMVAQIQYLHTTYPELLMMDLWKKTALQYGFDNVTDQGIAICIKAPIQSCAATLVPPMHSGIRIHQITLGDVFVIAYN